jgi:phytoene synthase
MSFSPTQLDASYAFCRETVRKAGSNFTPCFFLLNRSKRQAMEALYAFMRHTDDLTDNPRPASERRRALDRWQAALLESLSGQTCQPSSDLPGMPLLPALADAVRRFEIPQEYLEAAIEGVAMDLERHCYETFADLAEYCHRVASAVGLACIYVWGFRGPEAFGPATQCGLAFQLTNILRDLREDVEQGRIYLPLEDFRQCGYSPEDLARGVVDQRFQHLVELETDRAAQLYREGGGLMRYLESDGRRIFGMMFHVYHSLLMEIRRRPNEIFRNRIRLGGGQKLAIALRWIVWPPRTLELVGE